MKYITFSPSSFADFKARYEACEPGGTFLFEGNEVLKEYAKYVIQYVERELKKQQVTIN